MSEEKKRAFLLFKKVSPVMIAGVLYALWIRFTGLYIPCPFRLLTGYLCPGCGISHCCMALLRGDLHTAFQENAFVTVLLPFGLVYAVYRSYRFIRYGKYDYSKAENTVFYILLTAALLFGILRNIPLG